MNEIENIKSEMAKLQKRIDALSKKETTFEVNKWYKARNMIACFKEIGNNNYGVISNEWNNGVYMTNYSEWTLATDSEVFEALKKEAIKRGFKEGIIVKGNGLCYYTPENTICSKPNFRLQQSDMTLWVSTTREYGMCIFKDGIWAEVLKEEPIKIGGYEVIFYGDKSKGDMLYTKIDGNDFLKHFWEAAKIISEHSKAKIMVGCSKQFDVSLETINKILSKL